MRTTTLTKTTLPFAAVALLAATSQAAVVNVDIQGTQFGGSVTAYTGASANGPIASDNTWNYFNVGTTNGQSLSAGGLTFTFGSGWLGSFADAAKANNLQGDRVFASTGVTGTMTISGLDITKNYNLALISGSNDAGGFGTDFTIIGEGTKTATAASISGTGNGALTFVEGDSHVLFSGISGGTGSITFSVTDSSVGANGVLSGLQIESVTVPEPSTTALLGLGGLALIFRRRK